uniref:Uncharacterized protein n=1 Tax=Arundo donax TaxID=35708 RepID=A0A0A8XYY0_ARUDO
MERLIHLFWKMWLWPGTKNSKWELCSELVVHPN